MKKKIFFCLLLVMILIFCSCIQNPGTASLKLRINMKDDGRSIIPQGEEASLDVVKYLVEGTGPGGAKFNIESDDNLITIDGLVTGKWQIQATGLNNSGKELIKGTLDYELTGEPETAEMTLNSLIGSGTMEIEIDWEPESIKNPELKVFIEGGIYKEEQQIEVDTNIALGTASIKQSLTSGSYLLRGQLFSGKICIAGFVEAIRISNGTITSGNVSLDYESYANEYGSLYINDCNGVPVTGRFTGIENEIPAKKTREVSFIPDIPFSESLGLKMEWYYDGKLYSEPKELKAKGNSITIDPDAGTHRIDAIVYNSLLGSTGSVSFVFTAKLTGSFGDLANIAVVENDMYDCIIDEKSMVAPTDYEEFMLLSPNQGKLQICSMQNNRLKVERVYDTTDFDFISDIYMIQGDINSNIIVTADDRNDKNRLSIFSLDENNCLTLKFQMETATIFDLGRVLNIDINGKSKGVSIIDSNNLRIVIANCEVEPKIKIANPIGHDLIGCNYFTSNNSYFGTIVTTPESTSILYTPFNGVGVTGADEFLVYSEVSHINCAQFLNENSFVVIGDTKMERFYNDGEVISFVQSVDNGGQWADFYKDQILYVFSKETSEVFAYTIDDDGNLKQLGRTKMEASLSSECVSSKFFIGIDENGKMEIYYIIQE